MSSPVMKCRSLRGGNFIVSGFRFSSIYSYSAFTFHNAFILLLEANAWVPQAVPDLEDWVRKLAATSSYDKRRWRELLKGLEDVSKMRPAPPGEGTKSSIPKSEKDNKRKRVSKSEKPQDKKTLARRLQKRFSQAGADSAHDSTDDEEKDGEELALVPRTRKPIEAAKPSEPETSSRSEGTPKKDVDKAPVSPVVEIVPPHSTNVHEGTNAKTPEVNENAPSEELGAATTCHSLSLPTYFVGAIKEANTLRMPDPSRVLEEDPFQGCFAGVEDATDLNDVSIIFEEAQHLLSQLNTYFHLCNFLFPLFPLPGISSFHVYAIVKFRSELRQFEAELRKVSGEEKALRLLCSRKEEELMDLRAELAEARKNESELDEKESIDKLATDKKALTAQLASAETQLRGVKAKGLAQAKKIKEMEADLAIARAKAVQAKAKTEETKAAVDKSIIARRETLEEIHAQGFDLVEEIAEAKAQETDAKFLVSSDDEDVVSGSGEEDVPEGEEAPEDRATEGAVPEDDAPGGVTPKID
ncbi:uncharacterized protein [Nicotiana sylvestris]|uniref:uncharacterized protein n=1 Tax=Nicotiana sylvestris TaxID=4096 RepID=UPI00388CC52A